MNKKRIKVKKTKFVTSFLFFLSRKGYIYGYRREGLDYYQVHLKDRIFENLEIVSKSSKKIYWRARDCGEISQKSGLIVIISTSQGLLTADEAYRKGIGGKVLCTFPI